MQLNKMYIHMYVHMCTYIYIPINGFKAIADFSLVYNAEFEYLHAGSVSHIKTGNKLYCILL